MSSSNSEANASELLENHGEIIQPFVHDRQLSTTRTRGFMIS